MRLRNKCSAEVLQLSQLVIEIFDSLVDLGVFPT
jgi:hypothetical protein